jgi:anaerobic magnesium-protoporphyrin IX monomethyl ester cyclase
MKIVLATLHAKYVHASLALPCLAAATSDLTGVITVIREFTVNEQRSSILRALMEEDAAVIAFSCYIWNVEITVRLAADLKRLRPDTMIIAGGPEVAHTAEAFLKDNPAFDWVICGEGEAVWRALVQQLLRFQPRPIPQDQLPAGIAARNGNDIFITAARGPIADLDDIPSPFSLGLVDLHKPLVYYETSRGCPFSCAFCLSSLEQGVRSFSWQRIQTDLQLLLTAGVAVVKLVDRTFNYDAKRADAIWEFILARNVTSSFHFEIAADLLTNENLSTLARVPHGMFRFEIGVQATGSETLKRVARNSDTERLFTMVRRLVAETGVTVHLDLVAGLPGEDFRGFLDSLDQLFAVRPHHIQVEPLKVLKGSAMAEIAAREGYVFSTNAPYVILRTPDLSYETICRIEDISRLLDQYYNSGRFRHTVAALAERMPLSAFFDRLAQSLNRESALLQTSVKGLFEQLWTFVSSCLEPAAREVIRDALCFDYCLGEYPSARLIPSFFPEDWQATNTSVSRDTIGEILGGIAQPPGSRVRTFSGRFARDYSCTATAATGPTRFVFVYVAAAGAGLRVTPVRVV